MKRELKNLFEAWLGLLAYSFVALILLIVTTPLLAAGVRTVVRVWQLVWDWL